MKRKTAVNLNIPPALRRIAEAYSEEEGRSLSNLVETLLREYLDKRGVKIEVTEQSLIARLLAREEERTAKARKIGKASAVAAVKSEGRPKRASSADVP